MAKSIHPFMRIIKILWKKEVKNYESVSYTHLCHCCGRQFPFMEECPSCHSKNYFKAGMGTERLEEQILEIFKDHHVVRMDADSTRRKMCIRDRQLCDHQFKSDRNLQLHGVVAE